MVRFAYTILYVQDVAGSLHFYEAAFGFNRKFMTDDGSYGELSAGETTLAFATTTLARTNLKEGFTESSLRHPPFGIEIGFTTTNVEATIQVAVAAGAVMVSEPVTKPWGQVVAYLRDVDGFLIELCTPLE